MKRLLSTALAVVLLLGLAALAVLARPNGTTQMAMSARADSPVAGQAAGPVAAGLAGVKATANWNAVAIPLNNSSALPDAQALANVITGTQQLLHWDAVSQAFEFYIPDPVFPGGLGTNFPVVLGQAYLVQVDSTAPSVFSMVGGVPPQSGQPGALQFSLAGGAPCKWNYISLPLDRNTITTAQQLADAIGGVEQLLRWDAATQGFEFYVPDPIFPGGLGTDFATRIGYPYFVCMAVTKNWP